MIRVLRESDIIVEQIEDGGTGTLRPRQTMYVAHGPGGFTWMLKRLTAEAARRDGLACFLLHHVQDDRGQWWGVNEFGEPHHDSKGQLHPNVIAARDNYDGPPDGEAWSGGIAENH